MMCSSREVDLGSTGPHTELVANGEVEMPWCGVRSCRKLATFSMLISLTKNVEQLLYNQN